MLLKDSIFDYDIYKGYNFIMVNVSAIHRSLEARIGANGKTHHEVLQRDLILEKIQKSIDDINHNSVRGVSVKPLPNNPVQPHYVIKAEFQSYYPLQLIISAMSRLEGHGSDFHVKYNVEVHSYKDKQVKKKADNPVVLEDPLNGVSFSPR